jgi:acyl-coenzyme A thioesterase PaaI-like protein
MTERRKAADPFGEWASSKDVLMSYRYLASAPHTIDRTHAENLLHIRRDLRTPVDAMLTAPLAIAMLDTAGVNVDPVNILALTQVNITLVDHGRGVDDVFVAGRVATEARSQIFTEASFYDDGDREKLIGLGSANWSVICPTPGGFAYPEPGEGIDETSDVPSLWHAYTGRRRADGLLEIPGLTPEIGADRLHHGPMLVVTEAAAIEAGASVLGTDALCVDQLATTIVAPGRVGPFVAVPVSVGTSDDSAACRVELRDYGRDDRLVATTVLRMRRID